jgi:hypothetical protein
MIHTAGFQSEVLSSVTENIDKFINDMTKEHGGTFRLIDIKFAAAVITSMSIIRSNYL